MAPKSPPIFITFSDTYMLCRKFGLKVMAIYHQIFETVELVLTFSALSHSAGSPMKSFGLVERKRLYVKPKIPYTLLRKSRQPFISDDICFREREREREKGDQNGT